MAKYKYQLSRKLGVGPKELAPEVVSREPNLTSSSGTKFDMIFGLRGLSIVIDTIMGPSIRVLDVSYNKC
jgi:hypothetical protein